jgi:hypothetical protein
VSLGHCDFADGSISSRSVDDSQFWFVDIRRVGDVCRHVKGASAGNRVAIVRQSSLLEHVLSVIHYRRLIPVQLTRPPSSAPSLALPTTVMSRLRFVEIRPTSPLPSECYRPSATSFDGDQRYMVVRERRKWCKVSETHATSSFTRKRFTPGGSSIGSRSEMVCPVLVITRSID